MVFDFWFLVFGLWSLAFFVFQLLCFFGVVVRGFLLSFLFLFRFFFRFCFRCCICIFGSFRADAPTDLALTICSGLDFEVFFF